MFVATESNLNGILPSEQYTWTKLAKSAAKIAFHNFDWRYVTLVIFNSSMFYGVQTFISSYERSQIIVNDFVYLRHTRKTQQYVLFSADITEIMNTLDWMKSQKFDNTGKYLIICESEIDARCDEEEAANVFWSHKIINVVFLKHKSRSKEINGYVYNFNEDCHTIKPYKLNTLNTCLNINETKCSQMFPVKLTNLHRCPIIVSTFVRPPYMNIVDGKPKGADGDLLLLIADRINATLVMMTPRRGNGWGSLRKDGNWTGSLADVYDNFANFSMTSAAVTLARFTHFQMSIDYHSTKIVWITHRASLKSSSLKLIYPFQLSTQVAVLISFTFVIFCAVFMRSQFWRRFNQSMNLYKPRYGVIFYSWVICMGLPATKLPVNRSAMSIVILWMWYCIMLRTVYQAFLMQVLQKNYYFKEFETIEEAYAAHYRFGGGLALKDYYIDYPLVYDRWNEVNISDIIPVLYKLSDGLQFVIAMNMETAITIIRNHNIKARILSQKVVISPAVIFFKKFSPLVKPVNRVLRRLIESGFSDKSYKDHVNLKISRNIKNAHQPITTDHYTGCYVILLFGWILSIILFIVELCLGKMHWHI
ncbi:uncharacterized protein LOC113515628 [Galleria mellonella]|uniref:Uncharacterized protein LOC113515628 n=1 Tax=Galleria mellonella TaxID=7137 RepID=A0A6J1WTB4_GALME|nr:uncharacterized protein LOC113515628 [Galleria mellonella]